MELPRKAQLCPHPITGHVVTSGMPGVRARLITPAQAQWLQNSLQQLCHGPCSGAGGEWLEGVA